MLLNAFLDYLRYERGSSVRTITEYRGDLKAFESFYKTLDPNFSWETVDTDIAREWMVNMVKGGHKATSVHRRLSALRSFYKFLYRRGYVEKNPVLLLAAPKRSRILPSFLRDEEMERLLDQEGMFANSFKGRRDRLIIDMFYETGLRVSELVGLNLEDINLNSCTIRVLGKRNKQRMVPFGERLLSNLYAYSEERIQIPDVDEKAFLVSRNGHRLSAETVRRMVNHKLAQVSTLHHRSPHVLRHTFATSMLNHKANLYAVKQLLGHESLSTTEIYTHMTFEELKREYNEAHPRA